MLTDTISAALPVGFRARDFRDDDREAIVAENNATLPEVEHQSASEWREWERSMPDETRVRIVVEAPDHGLAAQMDVSNGGPFRASDGSARGGVRVARAHRRRGLGSVLLPFLEAEARRLGAPTLHGGVSAREPEALEWATARGYREIGRRIQAAIDLGTFDPARWQERARKPVADGVRFATLADRKAALHADALEALLREMYAVEAEAWDDVPIATPMPHWSYDVFRRLLLEQPGNAPDLDVIAFEGDTVVGFTSSYRNEGGKKGGTAFTGTLRAYRGRGIAFALKVEALTRAKASGIRWMLTTNDEPNKPMRGINYALGYEPLPAHVQLEKAL